VLHVCRTDRRAGREGAPRVRFEGSSFETLVRLVDAGTGLTVLPRSVVVSLSEAQRTRVRPFPAPVPAREVSLVCAREHLRRRIAEAIVAVIARALPAALGPEGWQPSRETRPYAGFHVLPVTPPESA
jgi:LysR family transcriptional regulator, hydrogen peroxide-inducible genes activator